jgi:MFS family permease
MKKQKLIILFTVLVDVIGFGIVIPILPFYVTEFGGTPFVITAMFASFSICAFLSAPLLGAISDRVGRRPVLIISILSTAIGWFVFAGANSIPLLFLGRIIDGAAAGNFTIAQSYIADISGDDKDRSANLGLIGAVFGVGFMLGPLLGGILSTVSHAFPFWIAGGLALANTVTAYFFLPETHHHRGEARPLSFNPLRPLQRAMVDTRLRPLFLTWLMFTLAFVTSQSVFALFVKDVFQYDSFMTGMLFTGTGVIVAINQTVFLKRFWLKHFSESSLEIGMLAGIAVSGILAATKLLSLFYVSLVLNAIGQSVLRVVVTSQVAGKADPKMKGETLGILSSIMAASMATAPLIAGMLFELKNVLPFLVASGYLTTGLVIAIRHRRRLSVAPVGQVAAQ